MAELILKEEAYQLIGICMEVHRESGTGFKEGIYQDALEIEFQTHEIPHQREKLFKIESKGKTLKHRYKAVFIVFNRIVSKVKATAVIVDSFVAQTINYLKASGLKLGIIANFGEKSLAHKRIVCKLFRLQMNSCNSQKFV